MLCWSPHHSYLPLHVQDVEAGAGATPWWRSLLVAASTSPIIQVFLMYRVFTVTDDFFDAWAIINAFRAKYWVFAWSLLGIWGLSNLVAWLLAGIVFVRAFGKRWPNACCGLPYLVWMVVGIPCVVLGDWYMLLMYPFSKPQHGQLINYIRLKAVVEGVLETPGQILVQTFLLCTRMTIDPKAEVWPMISLLMAIVFSTMTFLSLMKDARKVSEAHKLSLPDAVIDLFFIGLERRGPLAQLLTTELSVTYEGEGSLTEGHAAKIVEAVKKSETLEELSFLEENNLSEAAIEILVRGVLQREQPLRLFQVEKLFCLQGNSLELFSKFLDQSWVLTLMSWQELKDIKVHCTSKELWVNALPFLQATPAPSCTICLTTGSESFTLTGGDFAAGGLQEMDVQQLFDCEALGSEEVEHLCTMLRKAPRLRKLTAKVAEPEQRTQLLCGFFEITESEFTLETSWEEPPDAAPAEEDPPKEAPQKQHRLHLELRGLDLAARNVLQKCLRGWHLTDADVSWLGSWMQCCKGHDQLPFDLSGNNFSYRSKAELVKLAREIGVGLLLEITSAATDVMQEQNLDLSGLVTVDLAGIAPFLEQLPCLKSVLIQDTPVPEELQRLSPPLQIRLPLQPELVREASSPSKAGANFLRRALSSVPSLTSWKSKHSFEDQGEMAEP